MKMEEIMKLKLELSDFADSIVGLFDFLILSMIGFLIGFTILVTIPFARIYNNIKKRRNKENE